MSRPLYETSNDLIAERAFISDIEVARKIQFLKLPIEWKVDGFIKRGQRTIAIAEIKIRHAYHDQYPDIILSEKKVKAGLKLQRHLWGIDKTFQSAKQLQFLFLVRFVDGDYYANVRPLEDYVVDVGGRTFLERDSADVERVAHIPASDFMKLEAR